MSETPELAPCPFCGGAATIGVAGYRTCLSCLAELGAERNRADAIAAWNRRARPAYDPATLEAAARVVEDGEWLPPKGAHFADALIVANIIKGHCKGVAAAIRALADQAPTKPVETGDSHD